MSKVYKKHRSTFKGKVALEALKGKRTLAELCGEYSVAAGQISAWKKQLEEGCSKIFEEGNADNHQKEIDRLYKVIGQITAERDFLEHVLKR